MENKIIKNDVVVTNEWLTITDTNGDEIPSGKIIIPLTLWNRQHDSLSKRGELPGLILNCDENPADFIGNIASLKLIAINFPAFTDGRGFSIAGLLRERYHFKGELRAYGNFIRDQLNYLKRCGFNSFQFTYPVDIKSALLSLNDFSDNYQPSSIDPLPLFHRRKPAP